MIVPGPPFPSIVSILFTACGASLGMRVSASRTMAVNNLLATTGLENSSVNVRTSMVFSKASNEEKDVKRWVTK